MAATRVTVSAASKSDDVDDAPTDVTSVPALAVIKLPIAEGTFEQAVFPGKPLFLLGSNGCGKSALLHRVVHSLPDPYSYVPGARNVYFDADELNLMLVRTMKRMPANKTVSKRQDTALGEVGSEIRK